MAASLNVHQWAIPNQMDWRGQLLWLREQHIDAVFWTAIAFQAERSDVDPRATDSTLHEKGPYR
jgi:hypothetical protein